MTMQNETPAPTAEHRFFHADCYHLLTPDTELVVGTDGYSKFGRLYAPTIFLHPRERLIPHFRRELDLERIRQVHFDHRASRLACFFAARTVEDAAKYAKERLNDRNRPDTALIYEVFAHTYHEGDMMQLDIAGPNVDDRFMEARYHAYWRGEASSDPIGGKTRAPMMEIMIPLPVRVGQVVKTISVR